MAKIKLLNQYFIRISVGSALLCSGAVSLAQSASENISENAPEVSQLIVESLGEETQAQVLESAPSADVAENAPALESAQDRENQGEIATESAEIAADSASSQEILSAETNAVDAVIRPPSDDPQDGALDDAVSTLASAEENNREEINTAIDSATGIQDFDFEIGVTESGDLRFQSLYRAVETEPSPGAMVKEAAITPDIFDAMREALKAGDLGLSEREQLGIEDFYNARQGALAFVTNAEAMQAVEDATAQIGAQGLPRARYEFAASPAYNEIDKLAQEELKAAAFVVRYTSDMERGIVNFSELGGQFDLDPKRRNADQALADFASADDAAAFFAELEPKDPAYAVLKNELSQYRVDADNPELAALPEVPGGVYKIGARGEAIEILRSRLTALGFAPVYAPKEVAENDVEAAQAILNELSVGNVQSDGEPIPVAAEIIVDPLLFDQELAEAVRAFQQSRGLYADGIAGPNTLAYLNHGPRDKMRSLFIAMERLRWAPNDVSGRQIHVNIASFMVEVRDDNVKTFETRAVVGKRDAKYRTPEFHDEMEYVVINPTWTVPYSIAVSEFLPRFKRGGGLGSTYDLLRGGKKVNFGSVNWSKINENNFPYTIRQKPGPHNALGKVKFIFPNKHAIYLHDTPQRGLFSKPVRAYSHGCVRVGDPVDLATHLMAPYYKNPRASFDQIRATGQQRFVEMTTRIPVVLAYFTTYVDDAGQIRHVPDVYGRDRIVADALKAQGLDI